MKTETHRGNQRLLACGTKAVVRHGPCYLVVCATCDCGTTSYATKAEAVRACVRRSGQRCKVCGAS